MARLASIGLLLFGSVAFAQPGISIFDRPLVGDPYGPRGPLSMSGTSPGPAYGGPLPPSLAHRSNPIADLMRVDGILIPLRLQRQAPKLVPQWVDLQKQIGAAIGNREVLADLLLARARIWVSLGEIDEAYLDVQESLNGLTGEVREEYRRQGLANAFREMLMQTIVSPRNPDEPRLVEAILIKAIDAYYRGDYPTARDYLNNVVQYAGDNPMSWYYRALTNLALGDTNRALHDVRMGVYAEVNNFNNLDEGDVDRQLVRLQGEPREWLLRHRSQDARFRLQGVESALEREARRLALEARARERANQRTERSRITSSDPYALRPGQERVLANLNRQMEKEPGQSLPDLYLTRAGLWEVIYKFETALRDELKAAELEQTQRVPNVGSRTLARIGDTLARLELMPRQPRRLDDEIQYARALQLFMNRQEGESILGFSEAIYARPTEPIYWHFRALARRRTGDPVGAEADAKIGAMLEARAPRPADARRAVNSKLERIQGDERLWISAIRLDAR